MLYALLIRIRNQKTGQVVKSTWARTLESDFTKRATGSKVEINKLATELLGRCNPVERQFIEYKICELLN